MKRFGNASRRGEADRCPGFSVVKPDTLLSQAGRKNKNKAGSVERPC